MANIELDGQKAVLRPGTSIVASIASELRQQLKETINQGIKELEVDLIETEMIDSVGLGLLISAHNSLSKSGGKLIVINASNDIFDLFRNMRLNQHFSVNKANN